MFVPRFATQHRAQISAGRVAVTVLVRSQRKNVALLVLNVPGVSRRWGHLRSVDPTRNVEQRIYDSVIARLTNMLSITISGERLVPLTRGMYFGSVNNRQRIKTKRTAP